LTKCKLTNWESRIRVCLLLLTGMTLAVFTTGCAQLIPCRANLRLNIPATQKRTDELTIRMTEELRRLDIIVRPSKMPLTMSYKFQIGKSLEGNLASALQDIFSTTRVSSLPINDLKLAPFVLETELVNWDIHVGVSIFSAHTAKLAIRYSFYQAGRQLFTLETKTDGSSSMTSGEIWGRVLIPGEVGYASGYRGSIGRAYDEALAKSVNELVGKILEVVPRE